MYMHMGFKYNFGKLFLKHERSFAPNTASLRLVESLGCIPDGEQIISQGESRSRLRWSIAGPKLVRNQLQNNRKISPFSRSIDKPTKPSTLTLEI